MHLCFHLLFLCEYVGWARQQNNRLWQIDATSVDAKVTTTELHSVNAMPCDRWLEKDTGNPTMQKVFGKYNPLVMGVGGVALRSMISILALNKLQSHAKATARRS